MDEEAITIRLSRDQAFVLSDWLHQVMFRSDDLAGIVHDSAVWSPIYAISGALETTLSEVFLPDYRTRLEGAAARLRASLYGGADESTPPDEDPTAAPQVHQAARGTAQSPGESGHG